VKAPAPPGIYGSLAVDVTGLGSSPSKGIQAAGFSSAPTPGFGQSLFFVPGWNFFGATYTAQLVQRRSAGPNK
jgi:hypothetical protein